MSRESYYSCKSMLQVDSPILDHRQFESIESDLFAIRSELEDATKRMQSNANQVDSNMNAIDTDSSVQVRTPPTGSAQVSNDCDCIRPRSLRTPRQPSMYDNTDETSADFLTASQIECIVNLVNADNAADRRTIQMPACGIQRKVFGCDMDYLEIVHNGHLLPPFIENALVFLLRYGINCVGVFRRSGVRSRVNALKQRLEQVYGDPNNVQCKTNGTPTNVPMNQSKGGRRVSVDAKSMNKSTNNRLSSTICANFSMAGDECCVFDLADLVKGWLRELQPHSLISRPLITTFMRLKMNGQLDQLPQHILHCLTDTQRDLLYVFLRFLSSFARNSTQNQMNAHNLAICLAPSMCQFSTLTTSDCINTSFEQNLKSIDQTLTPNVDSNANASISNGNQKSLPVNIDQLNALKTAILSADTLVNAQHCLEYLINNFEQVLLLSPDLLTKASPNNPLITSSKYCLLNEGNLLPPACQLQIQIPAQPVQILDRILYQRNLIDATIVRWRIVEQNEPCHQDVFEFSTQKSHLLPAKCFRIRRSWMVGRLQDQQEHQFITNSTFYTRLASPTNASHQTSNGEHTCGDLTKDVLLREEGFLYNATYCIRLLPDRTNSLLTVSTAIDLKGRSFYWYKSVFPQLMQQQMQTLRRTFVLENNSGFVSNSRRLSSY